MTIPFDIGSIDKTAPHLLADLIELLLFQKHEGNTEISKSDVEEIIDRENVSVTSESLRDEDRNDRLSLQIDDCWGQLSYRKQVFGKIYPFTVKRYTASLKNIPKYSTFYYLYIFLTICSRLRSFPPGIRQKYALHFVEICRLGLISMLPKSGEVKIFEANSQDRKEFYGNNLREALLVLGDQIATITNQEIIKEQSTSGDLGIDLVGVIPFNDGAQGHYSIFAQCAARGKDWPQKTLEAHPESNRGIFSFLHNPVNVVFIPACYRQANGKWVNTNDISGCILIDRLRLIRLLLNAKRNLINASLPDLKELTPS